MPLLQEEGFQVLLDMTLEGEKRFNLVAGYVTSSGDTKVWHTGLHVPGHEGISG